MGLIDNIINECDIALKTLSNSKPGTNREYPVTKKSSKSEELTKQEKSLSIQMMRVNLAGEVAAQALYRGQAMVCKDQEIKKHLIEAGEEETDHLIWCKKRLDELDGRSSVFNPSWYAGSFAIGAIFGIGFLREFRENPERKSSSTSRTKRKLVRRNFAYSIGAAWIITVPASATIAGSIYYLISTISF